jgi:hypothetical protein
LRYTSFVVRIWLPGDEAEAEQAGCRGLVEHIQSGTAARVHSLEEIQRFIQKWLGRTRPANDPEEDPSNPSE